MNSSAEGKNFYIRGIPAQFLEKVWKDCEPFIKRGLEYGNGEMTHLDVKEFIEERDMQLWLVSDGKKIVAAVTTQAICYRQKKVLRIITLAGKYFDDWVEELHKVLHEFACGLGCHGVEAFVRRGFSKKLQTIGFKEKYYVMYKDV